MIGFFEKEPLGPSYPLLPQVDFNGQSSIAGIFLLGDIAGKPLIKVGLNDGFDLAGKFSIDLGDSSKGSSDYNRWRWRFRPCYLVKR